MDSRTPLNFDPWLRTKVASYRHANIIMYVSIVFSGLKQVELKTQKTKFWRHQRDKPETYLATIEAIYYFLREYHEYFVKSDYIGQYDNLLFFFCFLYQKIKCLYDGGKKIKAYPKKSKS